MCHLTKYAFVFRNIFACFLCLVTIGTPSVLADDSESLIPIITEHPLDVIVGKGEPATLNCAAKGSAVQITWYKDEKPVKTNKEDNHSHRLVLQNGALFLLKVNGGKNDSDAGTYHCVAENRYGKVRSREASLRIALLLDDFKLRPRGVQAVLGHGAVLECSPPHGFPEPVVTWRKNEQEFPVMENGRISLHQPGNLVIDKVERKDAGMYQCVATNMVGEKVSNPVKLSVYEKPYFQVRPKDVTVQVGEEAKFDCRVSGDPMPSISWKKREQAMPVGRAFIAKGIDALTIQNVEIADEGEYICIAKNPAGSIEASAKLQVFEQPEFVVKPAEVAIERGGTAVFNCQVKGHPKPALFWSREGQQDLYFPGHGSADGRIKVSIDAQLIIKDAEASDAGYYTCSTLNAVGSNLAKAPLKVVSKTLSTSPPPVIIHGHSNQTLVSGSSAILPCQASGSAPLKIDWLKDGQLLQLENAEVRARFNQLSTGSLQIAHLRESDTGVYTCRAKNNDGQTTWTASLHVEDYSATLSVIQIPDISAFPTAPGKPKIGNITDQSVCLEWSPPEKSGAALVSGYILQFFSPEEGQTWYNFNDYIIEPNHCVSNLKPSHYYVFLVRAENAKGIGPPSEISNVAYTRARAGYASDSLSHEIDMKAAAHLSDSRPVISLDDVKTMNSTAVEVVWKTRSVEPLIEGYYIQWRLPNSADIKYMKVDGRDTQLATINGLKPFTHYEFFVSPFYGGNRGQSSNSLEGKTDEAPPSEPPPDVRVRMMNLTTLRISWQKPPQHTLNGICIGYQVSIIGGSLQYSRNITTNERAASVTLFHLEPNMSYTVKVAARTKAGIGVYRRLDPVVMNEKTLQEHKRLMHGSSDVGGLIQLFEKPWFIPVAAVVIWLVLVAIIAFIYWKWRNSRGKANARLGMPFIKINDGSVHMTARDAMWMDHSNFNSAQRSLLLSSAVSNGNCSAPPVYTQTPHQTDFYVEGQVGHGDYPITLLNTMDRSQSPHHYHYASLSGNPIVPTFYGGNQIMDDPSPYATTTLVMNNRRKWMQDNMTRPPVLPSNPMPSGPPPRFLHNSGSNTMGGRSSKNSRSHHFADPKGQAATRSESPPHTDVSYVQSSDGTGGSSNGHAKLSAVGNGRRSPPRQTLMDFMPPPPPEAPPPDDALEPEYPNPRPLGSVGGDQQVRHRLPNGNELYDAVSENLLSENAKHYNRVSPLPLNRPNSRLRAGYRSNCNGGQEDDDSQRSSLMMDENGCLAFCSSSEADEENSEVEGPHASPKNDVCVASDHVQHRPLQPCMGVSASALSQSSYDGSSSKRSISRLKQPPPQRLVKNELV